MDTLVLDTLMVARAYVYRLFHLVLGQEPTEDMVQAALADQALDAFDVLAETGDTAYQQRLDAYRRFAESTRDDVSEILEGLKDVYTSLFIGPEKLEAAPWECLYNGKDRQLLQPSTLEVRNIYRSQGFLPQMYPHVSDDHIALELDFMYRLADRAEKHFHVGEQDACRENMQISHDFLAEHLNTWVPAYAEVFERAAGGQAEVGQHEQAAGGQAACDEVPAEREFYTQCVRLCEAFLALDENLTAEVLEALS